MIVNLTPHPMHIYPADCPDRIVPGTVDPLVVLPAYDRPPRLGETELGAARPVDGVPVVDIRFGGGEGLPEPGPGVWLVVSRPVAMVNRHRCDLLVPHHVVRDLDGSTLGCRAFGRPL
ncbi:hypothetical protein GCM10010399_63800 [Dactylosporangium fulvum]|uniref:Uncharacterized protein n=1 Tax=Dactylosporangium fulvum TaxID=53359 RepID=A0ABY5W8B5_9ACTN|nr:hypothetical protein [Dactylosporangium fulvum]UWP85797.1 hypothetical protein Dfulv_16755 [Dactylosporangium fulvum]